MDKRKIIIVLTIIIIAGICVATLWRENALLLFILMSLSFLKHKIFPIAKELILYTTISAIGAIAEIAIIYGGAWRYTQPDIFTIPVWLPFLWGLTGIVIVSIHQGLQ